MPTGYSKFHMCEMQRLRVGSVSFLSRHALPRVRTPSSRDNSSALAVPRPGRSLVHQVLGRCVPRGVPVDWWNTRPSVVLTRARIEASKAANQDGCTPPQPSLIARRTELENPSLFWAAPSLGSYLFRRLQSESVALSSQHALPPCGSLAVTVRTPWLSPRPGCSFVEVSRLLPRTLEFVWHPSLQANGSPSQ